jgi:hypothetical protein
MLVMEDSDNVKMQKTPISACTFQIQYQAIRNPGGDSAVWAVFCGNIRRLYMPFGWHLTIAMTRSCEKYCQSMRFSSRHWLKMILSSLQAHFHVLGQWFYPTDSEFSDIIVIVIEKSKLQL